MKPPITDHADALKFIGEALLLHIDDLKLRSGTEGEIMILEEATKLYQAISDGADCTTLGSHIDAIHESIGSLMKASSDLVEGAQAQANEYAEELRKQTEARPKQSTGNAHVTVEAISEEITRRMSAIEKSSTFQEELEDQRAELQQEIETINELIKHGGDEDVCTRESAKDMLVKRMKKLDAEIKKLVETRDACQLTINELRRYDEAMRIIKTGLSPEIFEENLE